MAKASGYNVSVVAMASIWADWSRNPRGGGVLPSEADPASFALLKASVRQIGGLVEPIIVVKEKGPNPGEEYRVIAGYRRFEALDDLSAGPDAAKFENVPIVVRAAAFELATVETVLDTEGTAREEVTSRTVSGETAELLVAAAENGIRQDVSAWDKITLVGKLAKEGLAVPELQSTLSEGGSPLGPSTVRNYLKVASLGARVQKKLRGLGGLGYRIALKVIHSDYNLGTATAVRWDVEAQMSKISEEIEMLEKGKKDKKDGIKKAKYAVKAEVMVERFREIEKISSDDVIAALGWLLGLRTKDEVSASTDAAFAMALCGSDVEVDEETGELERGAGRKPCPFFGSFVKARAAGCLRLGSNPRARARVSRVGSLEREAMQYEWAQRDDRCAHAVVFYGVREGVTDDRARFWGPPRCWFPWGLERPESWCQESFMGSARGTLWHWGVWLRGEKATNVCEKESIKCLQVK